ncbi:hypothetical protein ACFL6I_03855 [candidate division KSB1 bacterium]
MKNLVFEESCVNCQFWEELPKSNPKDPVSNREGTCKGKFKGDWVFGNQYCLGFKKK